MKCKWGAFAAKISPGVLPVDKIMTLLTLFENMFFLNNSAAFWDFQYFSFVNARQNDWLKFCQLKKKKRFFWPLKVGSNLNHHIKIMFRPNILVKMKCYQICTLHKSNSLRRENKKGHVYNVHFGIITVS